MHCSMALPSKFFAALHGQSIVGSMCDYTKCRSLDLSVLVGMPSEVVSDHGTVPRPNHRKIGQFLASVLHYPLFKAIKRQ